jgi:hypothetical protein
MEKIILIFGAAAMVVSDPTQTFIKIDQEILLRLFS